MRIVIDDDKDLFRAITYLKNLNKDKKWTMEVKEYRKDRSGKQNKMMWMWLGLIGNELGYDKDDLHAFFKAKFLGMTTREVMGEVIAEPHTSTTLNTKEFTEYLEQIDRFTSTELGISLPHPEDIYYEAMGMVK